LDTISPPLLDAAETAAVQRRTLRLLFLSQVIGGIGVAIGVSVGALLVADVAGVGMSGLAQSAAVVGAALLAIPATRLARERGRRPSLAAAYMIAALGGALVVTAVLRGSTPLLFVGFFLFGGATAANLQARYAAIDLAPSALRGRHLSLIVWATTIGAVAGPNLAPMAGAALRDTGVPTLAGPFVFSAVLFLVQSAILLLWLRPDPLLVAQREAAGLASAITADQRPDIGMRPALTAILADPAARLGATAMAAGHVVMVGIMAMTPVHILGAGHDAADTLRIVGIVLSLHIAGMYAFSPITGWLTDRIGRRPVILTGVALLLLAAALAGTAGHGTPQLATGLLVLGLGWSCTMVAGSTLLAESVPLELRPSAQGVSDVAMGLAGASAAAVSGLILKVWGYPTLVLLAAVATVPLLMMALRSHFNRPSLP
jgi:MFS family permease